MKQSYKKMLTGSIVALSLLTLGACSGNTQPPSGGTSGNQETTAQETQVVQVIGSTSVEPLITALADQFSNKNGNIQVQIQAPGSSGGITAVNEGSADIGMSSRELKGDETGYGLTTHTLALDGIAVIVNKDNPISDLTSEQLSKIFAGTITNWKEVGGPDEEILLVIREAGSGTRDAFEELLKLDEVAEDRGIIADSTNAVSQNIVGKKDAIGYISLGSLDASTVKAISVDGVASTTENVINKTYKLSRPFLLLTKGTVSAPAQSFLDFVLSDDAQATITEKGFISAK